MVLGAGSHGHLLRSDPHGHWANHYSETAREPEALFLIELSHSVLCSENGPSELFRGDTASDGIYYYPVHVSPLAHTCIESPVLLSMLADAPCSSTCIPLLRPLVNHQFLSWAIARSDSHIHTCNNGTEDSLVLNIYFHVTCVHVICTLDML